MLKDIFRRRLIHAANHPWIFALKIFYLLMIIFIKCGSPFLGLIAITSSICVNLMPTMEDVLIPLSDREKKQRILFETLYYSVLYSLAVLIHNIIFIYVIEDELYVSYKIEILLFNVFLVLMGIGCGLEIVRSMKKGKKKIFEYLIQIVVDTVEGTCFIAFVDMILFKSFLYRKTSFVFLSKKYFVWLAIVSIIFALIEIVVKYRKIGVLDFSYTTDALEDQKNEKR